MVKNRNARKNHAFPNEAGLRDIFVTILPLISAREMSPVEARLVGEALIRAAQMATAA